MTLLRPSVSNAGANEANPSATKPDGRLTAAFLKSKHSAGLDYEQYLATDPAKSLNWRKIEGQLQLTDGQRTLIGGFIRRINIIVSSGIWCGDCSSQGPMIQAIADANPGAISVRWLDRDAHMDLSERIMINAGLRVPTVLFLAEDFEPVSILGDRTLTRYRAVAARQLGPSCPLPGAPIPAEELAATLHEWINEFERVHLLLRLSARLRENHGD